MPVLKQRALTRAPVIGPCDLLLVWAGSRFLKALALDRWSGFFHAVFRDGAPPFLTKSYRPLPTLEGREHARTPKPCGYREDPRCNHPLSEDSGPDRP